MKLKCNSGLIEGMKKGALCLLFLEYILENYYHFFLKFLLDFISGIIWACCCLNWKLITYRLNLYSRCRPYQFISFTCKILINYILQEVLNLIFIFVGIELFIIFIYYPFYQGSSTSAQWRYWKGWFSVVGVCPRHSRMFSSIPGLCPQEAEAASLP